MSAQQLADRLAEHGHEISRGTLSHLENGRRGVSVPDLIAIAWALDTSPLALVPLNAETVPGEALPMEELVRWWSGEAFPASARDAEERSARFVESMGLVAALRAYHAAVERLARLGVTRAAIGDMSRDDPRLLSVLEAIRVELDEAQRDLAAAARRLEQWEGADDGDD